MGLNREIYVAMSSSRGVKFDKSGRVVSQDAQWAFDSRHEEACRRRLFSSRTAQREAVEDFAEASHVSQTVAPMGRLTKDIRAFIPCEGGFFLPSPNGRATSKVISVMRTDLDYSGLTWEVSDRES